jgi:hypothetical protein
VTHAIAAHKSHVSAELQLKLHSDRRGGDPVRHGRAQADRLTRNGVRAAGAVAAFVWSLDLWLALGHPF